MPDNQPTLYLLDGMALAYRAHFVFMRNPRITSKGLNSSAVFGFANTLLSILGQKNLTHIAVAFDTSAPTFRHTEFPAYKAQREAMPEDLSAGLPYIRKLIEAFNIPVLTCDGYEADDIIGTLAARAEAAGMTTYMVTPDKDFAQLVSEKTLQFKPGRQGDEVEIMGVAEVLAKWGIRRVDQVIDILGLWGDTSDNIPGVPGVGEKTAKALIEKYDNIENLLAHTAELKGKQKENLETFAEQARLSRRLVVINREAPCDIAIDALARRAPDKAAVHALFAELEFNQLAKRVLGEELPAAPTSSATSTQSTASTKSTPPTTAQGDLFGDISPFAAPEPSGEPRQTIADVAHTYTIARSKAERAALIKQLLAQPRVCFDSETSGLDPKRSDIVGLSFSWAPHTGHYVPFPPERDKSLAILDEFAPVFHNNTIEKIGHNLKFDLTILAWHGMDASGPFYDTMLAAYLIAPEMRHSMDYLSEVHLNYKPVSISTLIGERGEEQRSIRDVPVEQVAEYAAEDADVTLQLYNVLHPQMADAGAAKSLIEVEFPLVPVLVRMEREGIRIDTVMLSEVSIGLDQEIKQLEISIHEHAGHPFNIDSPKQLGEILFEEMKISEDAKRTPTGQYATNESVLMGLLGKHEIIQCILDYRACRKLKSTYVDTLPSHVSKETGRVHTTYHQAAATTGRLASQDPNVQNIPIRTDRGREIRKAFVPRDADYVLLSADYSQIELRIIAELAQDEAMIDAFVRGVDIHSVTAAKVHGVKVEEVTREMRSQAKMVNFGVIYGISAFGLAQRLGISRTDAGNIINQYFRQYAGVQRYIERTIQFARDHGYVETYLGRRRYLRDINSRNNTVRGAAERNAINSPIQGTAAEMIKIAMITIDEKLREGGYKTRMLLQVHDELVFDLHRDEMETARPMIAEAMRSAIPMKVPIEVEMGTGENWLDAH